MNATLVSLLEANVRLPVKVMGDLRAQLAACTIAERAFLDLVERYGAERACQLVAAISALAMLLMAVGAWGAT